MSSTMGADHVTPDNSASAAALATVVQSTPISAKLSNRDKGHDHFRVHIEIGMTGEQRYVEIPVKEFLEKFLPSTQETFPESLAVIELRLMDGNMKEKDGYPALVSTSLVYHRSN